MPKPFVALLADAGIEMRLVLEPVDDGYAVKIRTFSGINESTRRQGVIRKADATKLRRFLEAA